MRTATALRHAPTLWPVGTVTDLGAVTAPTGWASARDLSISVPGIAADVGGEISIRNASGATGHVHFLAGGGNAGYYENTPGQFDTFLDFMEGLGYRLTQSRYDVSYDKASTNERLGYARISGRPASVIQYAHDTYSGGLPFTVVGSSGGSQQLGQFLCRYERGGIVQRAIMTDGPPFANVYKGCNRLAGEEAWFYDFGTNAYRMDNSVGVDLAEADTGPCSLGQETVDGGIWWESGIVTSGRRFRHPGTRLKMAFGTNDGSQAPVMGENLLAKFLEVGQPVLRSMFRGGGHGFATDVGGIDHVGRLIRDAPTEANLANSTEVSGTGVTVAFDRVVCPGSMILASHFAGTTRANVTPPAGWTLLSGASIDHPTNANLSIALYCRIATAADGLLSTTFTTPSIPRQSLYLMELDLGGPCQGSDPLVYVDKTSEGSSTAANSLTIPSVTTATAPQMAFAAWAESVAGAYSGLTDGFAALPTISRHAGAVKYFNSTSAVSPAYTMGGAAHDTVGALVTFKQEPNWPD